jgi:hypothetical protein
MKDYKYENLVCKGKRFTVTIKNCKDYQDSKEKATNWLINKFSLSKGEFVNQLHYLSKNIENGVTRIVPISGEEQLNLDLSSKSPKFHSTFERLYSGLLKEDEFN